MVGIFKGVKEIVEVLLYISDAKKKNPKLFALTKSVDDILAKETISKHASVTIH